MNTALIEIAERVGAELLPDNEQWECRMEIRSASSSRLYVVARRKSSGEWGCSCPGWKSRRYCKHLSLMGAELRKLPR
jgi:hypothetical protein